MPTDTTRRSRPWVLLAFAGLTFGLAVGKAFGAPVDYELILLTAGIAGLDSVRGLAAQAGAALARRRSEAPQPAPVPPPQPSDPPPAAMVPPRRYEPVDDDDPDDDVLGGYEPVADDDDYDPRDVLGVFLRLTPELVAPALYMAHRAAGIDVGDERPFLALSRAERRRWLAVAELTVAIGHGEPEALGEVLDLVADAAGGYLDDDCDAALAPAPAAAPEAA